MFIEKDWWGTSILTINTLVPNYFDWNTNVPWRKWGSITQTCCYILIIVYINHLLLSQDHLLPKRVERIWHDFHQYDHLPHSATPYSPSNAFHAFSFKCPFPPSFLCFTTINFTAIIHSHLNFSYRGCGREWSPSIFQTSPFWYHKRMIWLGLRTFLTCSSRLQIPIYNEKLSSS